MQQDVVLEYATVDRRLSTWTEEGPSLFDMLVSMSEGRILQFIAGSHKPPTRRILNVRIVAVGAAPGSHGNSWLYLGRLLKLSTKGKGTSINFFGEVAGRLDAKGRVGTIVLPEEFDYQAYDSNNTPALFRGPYYDTYRL
jgi:hypothetical protein